MLPVLIFKHFLLHIHYHDKQRKSSTPVVYSKDIVNLGNPNHSDQFYHTFLPRSVTKSQPQRIRQCVGMYLLGRVSHSQVAHAQWQAISYPSPIHTYTLNIYNI